jgi:beta-glucanase (GH16 family)
VAGGRKIETLLAFEDEFTDTSLNLQRFSYEEGFSIRNAGEEYYTSRAENVHVENGELVLTARAENYQGASYTSGSIETRGLQTFTYGRVEARIQVPAGRGSSPAFWMLPEAPGAPVRVCSTDAQCVEATWPAWGDIVIMAGRSERPNEMIQSASYATWDAIAGEFVRGEGGGITSFDAPVAADFHDYAVEWGPKRIDWYVDDERRYSFDHTAPEVLHPSEVNPFTQPFHIKISLAVGGLAEAPVAEDYPMTMRVQWLRVWQYE